MAERPKLIAEALLRGRSLPPTSGSVAQALSGRPSMAAPAPVGLGYLGNDVGPGLYNYPVPQPTLGQAFGKDAYEFASGLTAPLSSLDRMGRTLLGQQGGWQSMGDIADDASVLAGMATMSPGVPARALGAGTRFEGLLEQARGRIAKREIETKELMDSGAQAFKFSGPSGKALAQPDMSKKGGYRLTFFDDKGIPNGHLEFGSMKEALEQALRDGFKPTTKLST